MLPFLSQSCLFSQHDLCKAPDCRCGCHPPFIECPVCHWRSHNPFDISFRYCGHCHQFHDDL